MANGHSQSLVQPAATVCPLSWTVLSETENHFVRASIQVSTFVINPFTSLHGHKSRTLQISNGCPTLESRCEYWCEIWSQSLDIQPRFNRKAGGMLQLLSARPDVTFPTTKHHHPLASTKASLRSQCNCIHESTGSASPLSVSRQRLKNSLLQGYYIGPRLWKPV